MNRKVFIGSGVGWVFDAMDTGLLSFVMAALAKDWALTSSQTGLLASINALGMAIGAVLFGILADRVGRKKVFIRTVLLFSVASGLSAFSTGFVMLLFLRLFVGIGLGGELPVASSYVSEFAPISIRGRIVVLLESFWAVGWILAAILAYWIIPSFGSNGWRIAFLCAALPALFTILIRTSLPESPTFQTRNDSKTVSLAVLFSNEYKRKTLVLWVLWFTVVLSYYGIFLWLPSVMIVKGFTLIKSFQYVFLMSLAQLPGYFSAAFLIEKWGRKPVLVTYLLGTAISSYFFGHAETHEVLLIWGILLNLFNLGAWGALYAFSPEQYPSLFRTSGVGIAAGIGRVGAIIGPSIVGYCLARHVSIGAIFSLFMVITGIGILTLLVSGRETKGVPVE